MSQDYTYTFQQHMSFINPAGKDQYIICRDNAPMAEAYDPTGAREITEGLEERKTLRQQIDQLTTERDACKVSLDTMMQWCAEHGIEFDISTNPPIIRDKERDELRAQVALLRGYAAHYRHAFQRRIEAENQGASQDVIDLARIEDGYRNHLFSIVDQTPADAAQYVRGLEAALEAVQAYNAAWLEEKEPGITARVEAERMRQTHVTRKKMFDAMDQALVAKEPK